MPLKEALVKSLRLSIDWTDWWGGEKRLELEGVQVVLDHSAEQSVDNLEDIFYDAMAMSIYQGTELGDNDDEEEEEMRMESELEEQPYTMWKDLVSRVHVYCDHISIKQDDLCLELNKLHMWRNFEEEAVVTVERGLIDPLIRVVAIEEMVFQGAEGQTLAKVEQLLATITLCQGVFSYDIVADQPLQLMQFDGLVSLLKSLPSNSTGPTSSLTGLESLTLKLPSIEASQTDSITLTGTKPSMKLIDIDFKWSEGRILSLVIQQIESTFGHSTTCPALRVSPMADVKDCLQLQVGNMRLYDPLVGFAMPSGGGQGGSQLLQLPFSLLQSLDLTCAQIESPDIQVKALHLYLTQQACSLSFDQATWAHRSMKLSVGPSTTALRFKRNSHGVEGEEGSLPAPPPLMEFFEFEPVNRVPSLETIHQRQEQLMMSSEITIQMSLGELTWSLSSLDHPVDQLQSFKNATVEKKRLPWISLRMFNRKCNLELPNDWHISLDDGCLSLCLSKDLEVYLLDYRVNLQEVSIPRLLKAHRYLFCSLDPQERSLAISGDLKGLNILITGMLLDLSLSTLMQEREGKKHQLPERFGGNGIPQLNLEFKHCAIQPQIPPEWPPVMPHVVHAAEIHIKIDQSILGLIRNAHLMLCPRVEFLKSVQGVYSDGHQYWSEHGHVTVGKLNWGQLRLESNYTRLHADLDEIGAELCSDSMALLRHLLDYYLIIMEGGEGNAGKDSGEKGEMGVDSETPFKMDEDIFNPWTPAAVKPAKAATIPNAIVSHIFIPSPSDFPLGQSTGEPLVLEEDYFSDANESVVSEEPRLLLKIGRLYLRLLEGNHYQPLWKRNSVTNTREEDVLASYSFNDLRSPTEVQSAFSHVQSNINIPSGQGSLSQSPSRSSQQAWSTFTRHHSRRASHLLQKDRVELRMDGIAITLHDAPSDLRVRVRMNEIDVLDGVRASRWRSLLTRQLPDRHLTSGIVPMLRIDLDSIPSAMEEWNLFVSVEPIRMFIDQHTLDFLLQILNFDASDLLPAAVKPQPAWFFRKIVIVIISVEHAKISDIRLCLDYKPHHLKGAPSLQSAMMNLFPLEKATIHLPSVHLRGVRGSAQLFLELFNAWMPNLQADAPQALMRSLAPVRCLMGLGGGVAQLILLPTGSVDLTTGKRALKDTALHTLQLVQRVSKGGRVILEHVDDVFGGASLDNSRRRQHDADANIPDRLHSSIHSLSLSVQQSLYTIVAVPIHDWQQEGGSGAIKAIIRAVPVAILGPLREGLGGMEMIAEGLGGWLEPEMREEAHQKYKRY